MKYLKKIFENKKGEIVDNFEKSYKNGRSDFNLWYYGQDWNEVSNDYHLYDNYYIYKDSVFKLERTGDYSAEIVKLDKPLIHVKEEILKKIELLELAFNKIDTSL